MGVVPAMVSERLGLPGVTLGSEVTVDGQTVRIRRDGDTASDTVEGTLPLVLSVSDQANEPRYPSFKGIMAAKKKPVETWSLADLELAADQVGGAARVDRGGRGDRPSAADRRHDRHRRGR